MELFNLRTAAGMNLVIERDGAIFTIGMGLPGHGCVCWLRCADDQLVIEREGRYVVLRAGETVLCIDDVSADRVADYFGIAHA